MLVDTIENIERAGFRAIIKRAFRMRAMDCGLGGLCSDLNDVKEDKLVEWAKRERNRAGVIRMANRWVEIGRLELRAACTRAFVARKELQSFIDATPAGDPTMGEWNQRLGKIIRELEEAQQRVRLKTRQAELVFDLFK